MMLRLSIFFGIISIIAGSSCSNFMGSLRRDLRDEDDYAVSPSPTYGGKWAERGFLAEDIADGTMYSDRYSAVGHSERAPASMGNGSTPGGTPWISEDQQDANQRDRYRGAGMEGDDLVSFSNNPSLPPGTKRQYKNGGRATRADFVDESPNEGSLWASDGQTNYYFTKNKVRGIGDIININIEEGMLKDILQESKRTLTPREKELELAAAQERIRIKTLGLPDPDAPKDSLGTSAAAATRATAATKAPAKTEETEKEIPQATAADVDVGKSMEIKAGDLIMSEIIERYPNGNYKIRGTKRILYKKGQPRLLTVVGIVRGVDVSEDDTVNSGKIYEYRLEAIR